VYADFTALPVSLTDLGPHVFGNSGLFISGRVAQRFARS
jgi:hypothetical protein